MLFRSVSSSHSPAVPHMGPHFTSLSHQCPTAQPSFPGQPHWKYSSQVGATSGLCCSHSAHATSILGGLHSGMLYHLRPSSSHLSVFNGCCNGFASTWHQRPVLPCLQCVVPSFLWVTTPGPLESFPGVFPKSDCRGYQPLPRRMGYTLPPWLPSPCWAHSRLHLPLGKHSPAASEFCQTPVMGWDWVSLPSTWASRGP